MREASSFHQWVNTAAALAAIGLSSMSLNLAWKAQQAKEEKILIRSETHGTCRLEHRRLGDAEFVGLCWQVFISNASENKTSIVSVDAEGVLSDNEMRRATWPGLNQLELPNGQPVSLPVVIDSGETLRFIVRSPLGTPSSVSLLVTSSKRLKPSYPSGTRG